MSNPTAAAVSRIMLGAGLFACAYVVAAPRLFPTLVTWSDSTAGLRPGAMLWLVGLVLGALIMTASYLVRGAQRRS